MRAPTGNPEIQEQAHECPVEHWPIAGNRFLVKGQAPLIYLTTNVARVQADGCRFVFSDGHGLARITDYYDDLGQLDQVDWNLVGARYWADRPDDNDRQRRKQAEFLVWRSLDWTLIEGIGVLTEQGKAQVEALLDQHPDRSRPNVQVKGQWYY